MELQEKATKILTNHVLCNYCLGRQFSNLGTGTTNYQRGENIKSFLAMSFATSFSEDNINKLQLLSRSGCELAENTLRKKEIAPEQIQPCFICEDHLKNTEQLVDIIIPKIEEYEFSSILVGTSLPVNFLDREATIKKNFDTLQTEYLKQEFNRIIGKQLSKRLPTETNFQSPEIVIEVEPLSQDFNLKIKSLFIYGRYLKFLRTIPQTRWPCNRCRGKGCNECNNTGKRYAESVEELIEAEAVKLTQGVKGTLHGAGREDIDALMLGTGRPFVMEIEAPRIRSINLKELEKITNESTKGKIEVNNYRLSSKKEVIHIKGTAKDSVKKYRALIEFEEAVLEEKIKILEKEFHDKIIKQRTPTRVSHRRADKVREKKVFSIKNKKISEKEFEATITCDGGCYVKELISGDNERTKPSMSEIVGINAVCKELDVIEIEEKPFITENKK